MVINCEIQKMHFEKQKKWKSPFNNALELESFWWLTPRKWFPNGKRQVIAQLFKEISRNTRGSVVNILHFFFLSPFCFPWISAFPFPNFLIPPPCLPFPSPPFLFSGSRPNLKIEAYRDGKFNLELGKVFLNKWMDVNEYNVVHTVATWWDFLDTKLFLIGEFFNLRNPICLLNLFSLEFLIDHGLKSQA